MAEITSIQNQEGSFMGFFAEGFLISLFIFLLQFNKP